MLIKSGNKSLSEFSSEHKSLGIKSVRILLNTLKFSVAMLFVFE